VSVAGGTENEDGSVTYTRSQLQQLFGFLSAPTLTIPMPTISQG
jgi:hypothetical protein